MTVTVQGIRRWGDESGKGIGDSDSAWGQWIVIVNF